jgi:hypothetical protein
LSVCATPPRRIPSVATLGILRGGVAQTLKLSIAASVE